MDKQNLTPTESLDLIRNMINEAKNKTSDNGFHFLWWGILVIVASMVQYLMIKAGMGNQSNLVWIAMPAIGVPVAFIYEYRRGSHKKTETTTEQTYGTLWMSFGITLGITIFMSVQQQANPIPFILALVGLATFVSGRIFRFVPLTLGGILFWVSAILALYIKDENVLLINAGSTLLGYIIPGIMLWKQSKSNNAV